MNDARESLTEDEFALLHRTRLRGMLDSPDALPIADELARAGLVERRGDTVVLTGLGHDRHAALARLEPGSEAETTARSVYTAFTELNRRLLKICHDWQMCGKVPNDHQDLDYDWKVIDRLIALDERVGPLLDRLGRVAPRFAGYRERFAEARHRVDRGEHEWFDSPTCDSYHTVWMQLHEDLLLALGLDRRDEDDTSRDGTPA